MTPVNGIAVSCLPATLHEHPFPSRWGSPVIDPSGLSDGPRTSAEIGAGHTSPTLSPNDVRSVHGMKRYTQRSPTGMEARGTNKI